MFSEETENDLVRIQTAILGVGEMQSSHGMKFVDWMTKATEISRLKNVGFIKFKKGTTTIVPRVVIDVMCGYSFFDYVECERMIGRYVDIQGLEGKDLDARFDFLNAVCVYCDQSETLEFEWTDETEQELSGL